MARVAATTGWSQSLRGFDPFKTIFKLLTSVRIAILLLALVALAALLGVVFPQAPDEVRAIPASYDAYTEFQRGKYGVLTTAMRRLGLFEVFHSYWFNGLVVVLLIAVTVCTFSRIRPIVRSVRHPVRRVNDRYFESAHHRADFSTPGDVARITRELRRRRYKVEETRREGETVYLLADRFQWAQYGTFVSHLALILFMAGAIVTKVVGFSTTISIPEGASFPVFPTIHAGQMQVQDLHSAAETNSAGIVTRYISNLAVYRDGKQICTGTSTVNDPMHCAGYTFHQTTMSNGVALQVRNVATGQLVYNEVPETGVQGAAPSPHLTVRDATGATLFDDNIVLTPADQNFQELYALLPLKVGGDSSQPLVLIVAAVQSGSKDWILHVSQLGTQQGQEGNDLVLQAGQSRTANGLTIEFPQMTAIPLSVVQGIPGMESAAILQLGTSVSGKTYLDLLNMGAAQTGDPNAAGATQQSARSDGTAAAAAPTTPSSDTNAGGAANDPSAGSGRLALEPGVPQRLGDYEYTFVGPRSITGITVRKDPGSTFIWVATALLLLGLAATFYLPRRRLWVKITPERTFMAGVADRIVNFSGEMRTIGAAAGSQDALVGVEE